MNLLEVKNICKTYGSGETAVKALKDVSFSVPKGEYVAVVGESGSGKSTLLNMIGALDTPTTGKVLIDGKDIFAMDERKLTVFRRRNIGFIFQAFNLVPELTVEQNIIFPVLLDYQKPDKKYLEELLAVLNLKERRNHLPSQLSGGQQQRVAIGRALITRPALILADEPTGNLDTQNSSEVIALLKEASKKYEQTITVVSRKRLTGYCRYRTVTSPILGGAGNEKLFKPCADLCKGAETAESDDHSVCHYFDISGDSNF
jgi:putative ABC transport system ATP-binding protein